VIGSGIFTIIGTAIAGPAPSSQIGSERASARILDLPFGVLRDDLAPAPLCSLVRFWLPIVCGFASVCYAELAAMIPIAGSAYTYTYATMGELIAWIIGWDLILEYAVSNMAVSVGFPRTC